MQQLNQWRGALLITFLASAACGSYLWITRWWPELTATDFNFYYWLIVPWLVMGLGAVALVAAILAIRIAEVRLLAACAVLSVTVLLASYGVARLVHGPLPTGSYADRFDAKAWSTSPAFAHGDLTARQRMLGDVVENVLPGKTRREIEAALGPSPDSPYFAESGRDLLYVTGPERDGLFAIDNEWLLIWLDDSGRFERYEIARD